MLILVLGIENMFYGFSIQPKVDLNSLSRTTCSDDKLANPQSSASQRSSSEGAK